MQSELCVSYGIFCLQSSAKFPPTLRPLQNRIDNASSLHRHVAFISQTLYHHFTVTLPSLRRHFTITLPSLQRHFTVTSPSLICHFTVTSPSLDVHFALTSQSWHPLVLLRRFADTLMTRPESRNRDQQYLSEAVGFICGKGLGLEEVKPSFFLK